MKMMIYPNPSDGRFNLNMNFPGEYRMMVYDATGNLLMDKRSAGLQDCIDLKRFPSGIYMLKIVIKNKSCFYKLVKRSS